jgi:hypothetical protein
MRQKQSSGELLHIGDILKTLAASPGLGGIS